MYNLETASQATGRAKNTIRAAILNGRISATQSATGRWEIDPAELHRLYPAVGEAGENVRSSSHNSDILIEILKEERQREREQLESTIRDLRARLDREAEERARLTRLLTHEPQKRPSWFERIFGA